MAWLRKSKPKQSQFTCLCGKENRPFVVFIEHEDPPKKAQIVGIKRVKETGTSLIPRLMKPAQSEIDTSTIDWTKFYCPWCGADKEKNSSDWVRCGECREIICAHGCEEINGKSYWHGHQTCSSVGFLTVKSHVIDATQSKNHPKPKSIAGPKRKALPAADRLKITKKK